MELATPRPLVLTARLEPAGVWLYGFLVIALVAGNTGGFEPTAWGWCAVLTLWLAAIGLLVRDRIELHVLDLTFIGGLLAFTIWVALSNLWTPSVTSTMHEVQRDLAYVGVVTAGLVLVRRRTAHALLGGVLAAIVLLSVYALGTRVLPDRFGDFDSETFGYRLATPITYWNGLGIFTVIGILLAAGFALRSRSLVARGLAGAALPVLVATMYFTFSRGAWVALGVGLVTAVALDPRRLQLLAGALLLAPLSAAALWQAEGRHGLTTVGATLAQATDDGHALVPVLLALAGTSAAVAVGFALLERSVTVPRVVRTGFAVAVVACLALGAAAVWREEGSPWGVADRAWSSFKSPPQGTAGDLSGRLFQLSSNGRLDLWETSWESFKRDPLVGNGAGTFWQMWLVSPVRSHDTTEGHSLYAETLGEMGVVGLALLLLALAPPLAAVGRARGTALGAPAAGAYAAWLAHAGIDWDWELVGVTAPVLLCGVSLVAAARARDSGVAPGPALRTAGVVACVVVAAVAIPSFLADHALAQGRSALPHEGRRALRAANDAGRWARWSSEPAELRGDAWRSLGVLDSSRAAYRDALRQEPTDWTLWAKTLRRHRRQRAHRSTAPRPRPQPERGRPCARTIHAAVRISANPGYAYVVRDKGERMNRGNRDLESRLRDQRAEPAPELVESILSRTSPARSTSMPRRGRRLVPAFGLTAVLLVATGRVRRRGLRQSQQSPAPRRPPTAASTGPSPVRRRIRRPPHLRRVRSFHASHHTYPAPRVRCRITADGNRRMQVSGTTTLAMGTIFVRISQEGGGYTSGFPFTTSVPATSSWGPTSSSPPGKEGREYEASVTQKAAGYRDGHTDCDIKFKKPKEHDNRFHFGHFDPPDHR